MINLQLFLFGLLITSTLTSLVTEGVKTICAEHNKKYYANTLAGVVSIIVSIVVGVSYILVAGVGFSTTIFVYLLALAIMSWLCAMLGYDKVIQTINQINNTGKVDDNE